MSRSLLLAPLDKKPHGRCTACNRRKPTLAWTIVGIACAIGFIFCGIESFRSFSLVRGTILGEGTLDWITYTVGLFIISIVALGAMAKNSVDNKHAKLTRIK